MRKRVAALVVALGVIGGGLSLAAPPAAAGNCSVDVAIFFYYGTAEVRRSVPNAAASYCLADDIAGLGQPIDPFVIPPGATGATARFTDASEGQTYGFCWTGLLGHCDAANAQPFVVAGETLGYVADTPIHMFPGGPAVSGVLGVRVFHRGSPIGYQEYKSADKYL
ncbi:MAG TPA: hypothetical protein VM840_11135 [Actinomycetota bacterium]|nr:hypothetical protein [Actinomycetota bacterium]